jgi:hypothetical protein
MSDRGTSRWAHYVAAGQCGSCGKGPSLPTLTQCARCRDRRRVYNVRYAHRRETSRLDAPGANLLAHCGRWHAVTMIPFQAPCCGAVLFDEVP